MSLLDGMKIHLQQLKYPNIETCTDSDVVAIFHVSNRITLLKWIVKQLCETIEVPRDSNLQATYLTNVIYEFGFCNQSQKQGLANGDSDLLEQLNIFRRIFNYLLCTTSGYNKAETISVEQLLDIVKNGIGNDKTMVENVENEVESLRLLNLEIKVLKSEIATYKEVPRKIYSNQKNSDLTEELLTEFSNNCYLASRFLSDNSEISGKLENISQTLVESNKNMDLVLEQFKDMRMIAKHSEFQHKRLESLEELNLFNLDKIKVLTDEINCIQNKNL